MDIIDAHHHFWNLDENYHPWLCDEAPISFRYGDYQSLRRNYMPSDLRRDAGDYQLLDSVYVETEWDPSDPVGESRWIQGVHEQDGLPGAVVAQAWLDAPDAAEIIRLQAEFPLVRSVRHKPQGATSADAFRAGRLSKMGDSKWRRGYELLGKHTLRFDLQTPYWHLPEAWSLANDFPEIPLILNHTGLPADRTSDGLKHWLDAMTQLASAPNVVVKISGLGQAGYPWTVEANEDIVKQTISLFGPQRCMFASNFPVDSLCADYATIYQGFHHIVADFSDVDKHALFVQTARQTYGLA